MRLLLAIVTLFLLSFVNTQAQQIPCDENTFTDAFLQEIEGDWSGVGQINKEVVRYSIHANWALNHQFFHISLKDISVPSTYSAEIYIGFNCDSNNYVAHWIDSFGGAFSETLGYGKATPNGILFKFQYPSGGFTNQFQLVKEHGWQMTTEAQNAQGEWFNFGNVVMKRN